MEINKVTAVIQVQCPSDTKRQQSCEFVGFIDLVSGKCRDFSVGKATYCELDDPGIESPTGARFSALLQTGAGAQPASYTVGIRSLPGLRRRDHSVNCTPPPSAKVKESVELYLYSPPYLHGIS